MIKMMDKIFHTWFQQQKLLDLIKSKICLLKIGYLKKLKIGKYLINFSEQKSKLKKDKNKKKWNQLLIMNFMMNYLKNIRKLQLNNKEDQYYKHKRSRVKNKLNNRSNLKLYQVYKLNYNLLLEPENLFVAKRIQRNQQSNQNKMNLKPDMLLQDYELQHDSSAFEKSYHDMSMQINPIVKSPKKKRKSPHHYNQRIFMIVIIKNLKYNEDEKILSKIGRLQTKKYKDKDFIGYDENLNKIQIKKQFQDTIDQFINKTENKDQWRVFRDELNNQDIVLTHKQLQMLDRIRTGKIAIKLADDYNFQHEDFNQFDLLSSYNPKRRFLSQLPFNVACYNPPEEYLFTEQEKQQ